jgi:glycerol-3-phosphate dehydrogenase
MTVDILIVGGGINGTAIARDAAMNGLSVRLIEKDDLASHTSSASTKLIHGGLRYLEYYEFKLVREALKERERLLRTAPHLIYPMLFVLPHQNAVRPWWLVRLGLFLYDVIGGRISLPRSRALSKRDTLYHAPLKTMGRGFVYSDAWVDDARLVVLNAVDAARHGATITTRTGLVSARRVKGLWHAELSDGTEITARAMINAAGPWVGDLLAKAGINTISKTRLIKGSHIVVEQLFAGNHAYMLQQADKRIVFAIAYEEGLTLIGTTDEQVDRPEDAKISAAEIDYLCTAANTYFKRQIGPADVVATYSGVRPLYDDGASEAKAVTRDYVLELDANGPPLLSVFGGKITTARHLAEEATQKIAQALGKAVRPVTGDAPLPGGNLPSDFESFLTRVRGRWPFLGEERSERMARAYGTMLDAVLTGVKTEKDMGKDLGDGLTQVEIDWLVKHEWATTAQDVLMRRTKIGLSTGPATEKAVTAYLKSRATTNAAAKAKR